MLGPYIATKFCGTCSKGLGFFACDRRALPTSPHDSHVTLDRPSIQNQVWPSNARVKSSKGHMLFTSLLGLFGYIVLQCS